MSKKFYSPSSLWAMTVYASRFNFCRFFRAPCVEKKSHIASLNRQEVNKQFAKCIYTLLYIMQVQMFPVI